MVNKEVEDVEQEVEKENESKDNEEDEKKKADALWADFLGSTESESSNATYKPEPKIETKKVIAEKPKIVINKKKEEDISVTKIFDFAGEAVVVTETKNGQAQLSETNSNDSTSSSSTSRPRSFGAPKTGGLGSVLSQLGKKNKLSVLEKSKLDWHSFKNNEGIQEELETHNKGKHGYVEYLKYVNGKTFSNYGTRDFDFIYVCFHVS